MITVISTLIISIASLIPIWQTWGRIKIGGDVILPLVPENLSHLGYQWMDTANGLYASNDYYYWIKTFVVLHKLGFDVYSSAFLYQFLIFFLSGLGIYAIFNLFNKSNKLWGLIPAVAFIYSPYLLDHMIYFQATACSVWLFYILFRFIRYKSFRWFDPFFVAGIVPFIGNLPNPKYHFLIFLTYVITILIAKFQKLITVSDLKRAVPHTLAAIGLTAFIWIPFIHFGVNFASDDSIQVRIRQGYRQTGVAIDYGGTFISKMFTLFHTPNLNPADIELIYEAPFLIAYYSIAAIVLIGTLYIIIKKKPKDTPVWLTIYSLAVIYLFLSKSSNPPFGYFYELMLTSAKIFAFMRTTAGVVIYAGIFYALLFGFVIQHSYGYYRRMAFPVIAVAIMLIAAYPFISGKFFLNQSPLNAYIDKTKHGVQIPDGYLRSAKFLAASEFNGKIRLHPGVAGYQNNTWGYYGFNMFPWMFKQSVIGVDPADPVWSPRNISNFRYILHDKTLFQDGASNSFKNQKEARQIFTSREIDLYEVRDEDYTPYFTVPKETIVTNKIPQNYFDTYHPRNVAMYLFNQPTNRLNTLPIATQHLPSIEFRKINPTKYRVRIHDARGVFPLIFQDAFHSGWKLYIVPNANMKPIGGFRPNSNAIDRTNAATEPEITDYIKNGWITGDTSDAVRFISKKFWTTIQNDNLPHGHRFESWGKKSIDENNHLRVNAYANSWTIDTESLCSKNNTCIKNQNGRYDFELIAEFFPQQIAYIGMAISLVTALCYGAYIVRLKLSNKK